MSSWKYYVNSWNKLNTNFLKNYNKHLCIFKYRLFKHVLHNLNCLYKITIHFLQKCNGFNTSRDSVPRTYLKIQCIAYFLALRANVIPQLTQSPPPPSISLGSRKEQKLWAEFFRWTNICHDKQKYKSTQYFPHTVK